jgi:hypothetical protein
MTAATALPWLALAAAIAGCDVGYPSADIDDRRLSAAERLVVLRRHLAEHRTEVQSIALAGPCLLRVKWKGRPEAEFALPALETLVDTASGTGDFVVHLQLAGSAAPSPLFLATPDWAAMTAVRSELSQLRAHCAEAQQLAD